MITKIGPYNNRVHFQALIKIKKSGIENLIKDTVDVSKISSRATSSASSSIAETTAFPADLASDGNALSAAMRSNAEGIQREAHNISARDAKTMESGEAIDLRGDLNDSAMGTSSSASGAGLYSSAAATGLEQSAYNPHSFYSESVHDGIEAISTPKSVEVLGNIENYAQEEIKAAEALDGSSKSTIAEMDSTYSTGMGSFLNWVAGSASGDSVSDIVRIEKNIPS